MKHSRRSKIIELIEAYTIETQDDLTQKLKDAGFDITQATVSRDIKELRLIKVMQADGIYKYAQLGQTDTTVSNRMLAVFAEAFVSCDFANNIVVVKTLSGMANAVAESIDVLKYSEILGTLAGDNTIIIVCRSEKMAKDIVTKFNKLASNG